MQGHCNHGTLLPRQPLRQVRAQAGQLFRRQTPKDTASLLGDAQGMTLGTLQVLVQMIEEKQRLVRLLNECIDGPGLTVVIGAEHLNPNLRPFSLVLSTYDDGSGIGTVGIIGPTRMRYSRAIAAVDGAAQAVSRVLRDSI